MIQRFSRPRQNETTSSKIVIHTFLLSISRLQIQFTLIHRFIQGCCLLTVTPALTWVSHKISFGTYKTNYCSTECQIDTDSKFLAWNPQIVDDCHTCIQFRSLNSKLILSVRKKTRYVQKTTSFQPSASFCEKSQLLLSPINSLPYFECKIHSFIHFFRPCSVGTVKMMIQLVFIALNISKEHFHNGIKTFRGFERKMAFRKGCDPPFNSIVHIKMPNFGQNTSKIDNN